MCNPNQKFLCGKKECNICYTRSLQKYLDDNNLNSNFVRCIHNEKLTPLDLSIGSSRKNVNLNVDRVIVTILEYVQQMYIYKILIVVSAVIIKDLTLMNLYERHD